MRSLKLRRGLAALALGSWLPALVCGPAAASTANSSPSANWIGIAQTVVVATTSTGKVSGTPRVFTQWSANGSGPATVKVPMSTSGFRNLSGLGTAPIKDGYAVWNLHLSGPTNQRSVAHFPANKLPLQVSAAYEFNGKKTSAKDIVGKTGELKVTYVITNVTTKPTKVSFTNVLGDKETTTVKAPVPVAAIVDVTVPASFTNLKAPGASANGNGNGTSSGSWTLFMFNPLGGVKQSITYQAHVTDATVPSATVEAAVLPSATIPPLPAITEPGAPAVPTVTLGRRLASLQAKLQAARENLASKASAMLSAFKQVAVPAVRGVSGQAAKVASGLPAASAAAEAASINDLRTATSLAQASARAAGASSRADDVHAGLDQASAEAADAATRADAVHTGLIQRSAEAADAAARMGDVRRQLETLPGLVRTTSAYRTLHRTVVDLELLLTLHAAHLRVDAAAAALLRLDLVGHAVRLRVKAAKAELLTQALTALSGLLTQASSVEANVVAPAAHTASTTLIGLVPKATALSTNASATATTLANATLRPGKQRQPVTTKQVGGGAKLDNAVGRLDAAITEAADKVDKSYAYLMALDRRASDNKLPAGNAIGATGQVGAFVYSVSGANDTAHQTHLSVFIGGFALVLGIGFGIGLYRIRRGMPSSLAPPKTSPAPAKG
jgi:hypothetical protein